ncbi:M10 family metallopeptidase C-terminal domain-containing protein [Carnimonas bestiolae]|uniref:M10 family metallopeptidase C-terminal domain-containing protein n=1 Tax=Carnimonas bestiolae TaxID=3402172 RepID=UPI003EDC3A2A
MSAYSDIIRFQLMDSERGDNSISGKPSYSVEQASEQLLRGGYFWPVSDSGPTVITYTFMTNELFPGYNDQMDEFSEFSLGQKEATRLALRSWSDVANIKFVEQPDMLGDIRFGNVGKGLDDGGITSAAHNGEHLAAANVWVKAGMPDPTFESYEFETLVHEIGHALGLEHPGDYDAIQGDSINYAANAPYVEDSRMYSVMSYWAEHETNGDFYGTYESGPMLDDIYAVQQIYGYNPTAFAGNTIYGFDSNTDRQMFSVSAPSDRIVFSVWDAGGEDTFDFSGYPHDQIINLNQGAFSSVGGYSHNISIALGTNIENLISGSGNDILIGNAGNNSIDGGDGDNIFYGGGGSDTLRGGSGHDVFVYLDPSESTRAEPDCILGFKTGIDQIDISAMADSLITPIQVAYDEQFNRSKLSSITADGQDFVINVVGEVDPLNDIIYQ